ncbi:hypothetical protein KAR28_06250 [Candidatus Parcubacteria bacterium]|nr:hypothetical protein [Candidatus Parcubacteria bacterium]
MRYPDTLKIHFIDPKKQIPQAKLTQLKNILDSYSNVVITHSYRYNSGIEYYLRNIVRWKSGRVVLEFFRKDDDMVPDNLK